MGKRLTKDVRLSSKHEQLLKLSQLSVSKTIDRAGVSRTPTALYQEYCG